MIRFVSLALLLLISTASGRAFADDDESEAETSSQYRNVFTFKLGHLYAINRPRESDTGHPPESEHLLGFVPSYGRVLIPGRVTFEIALPFFANTERFDTPIDITLILPFFRHGRWEPYFAVGATINLKIFAGERSDTEGTGAEFVGGFTGGLGLAYAIDERWLVEVELTYAWIPTSHIVEHELAQLAGVGYAF